MEFLEQVKLLLINMSEDAKDAWILSQAKLAEESHPEDFLLLLSGEKKIINMPTLSEIDDFCEQVKNGEIYLEYETHYYEFDDDGRYMDDWKTWHNDPCDAILFINQIFAGCHDLLLLEEYQLVSDIMDRICELSFSVEEAEDSEDSPECDFFSLSEADKENMFSRKLSDVGEDWIRAVNKLIEGQGNRERAEKLIEMLEHPVCQEVKPRILVEEGISQEIFLDMAVILDTKIADLEAFMKAKYEEGVFSREKYKLWIDIERKKEILLDIRVKCLKTISKSMQQEDFSLTACWEQVLEGIRWLSYEKHIDDQQEIEGIRNIAETLIRSEQLKTEDWKVRKRVLEDIIKNRYYDHYGCGDVMLQLAEKLCTNKEEHLARADIMDTSYYREEAAYLYYQYGREDKYVSYLEEHLGQMSKDYISLMKYYQKHDKQEDLCRIAQLGLEKCKEDLTDMFICLLLDAKKHNDQERFKKLLASAKQRKHVDIEKVKNSL